MLGRALAHNLFENTVKMSDRLKPNLKRHFSDADLRVEQQGFDRFHAGPRQIFSEGEPRGFFEFPAKIAATHVSQTCDLFQCERLRMMFVDKLTGPSDIG